MYFQEKNMFQRICTDHYCVPTQHDGRNWTKPYRTRNKDELSGGSHSPRLLTPRGMRPAPMIFRLAVDREHDIQWNFPFADALILLWIIYRRCCCWHALERDAKNFLLIYAAPELCAFWDDVRTITNWMNR